MIFVADLGKMPLFFCLLAVFSSSSSSVPSPEPMLFSSPPSKPPSVSLLLSPECTDDTILVRGGSDPGLE